MIDRKKYIHPFLDLWKRAGKKSRITVSGDSMKPVLIDGSQVLVEHCYDSIRPGDIIVFLRDNMLVTHRVIRTLMDVGEKMYLTKGDSALKFDYPLISKREIVGIVRGVIKGKNIIDYRKMRWRIIGRIVAILSFMAGTFPEAARLFVRIFCRR